MLASDLIKLAQVQQLRKIIEVEHRFVLTMLAKERDILAEIHILEMVRDKTPITPLYPLAKLLQDFIIVD